MDMRLLRDATRGSLRLSARWGRRLELPGWRQEKRWQDKLRTAFVKVRTKRRQREGCGGLSGTLLVAFGPPGRLAWHAFGEVAASGSPAPGRSSGHGCDLAAPSSQQASARPTGSLAGKDLLGVRAPCSLDRQGARLRERKQLRTREGGHCDISTTPRSGSMTGKQLRTREGGHCDLQDGHSSPGVSYRRIGCLPEYRVVNRLRISNSVPRGIAPSKVYNRLRVLAGAALQPV